MLEHLPQLIQVGYYQAPATADIRPATIADNHILIELILEGRVWFSHDGVDRERGPGSIFWHIAGDHTVHRNVPEDPYRCMVFRFELEKIPQRDAPRYSYWANVVEAHNFGWEVFNSFQQEGVDRKALCFYAFSRLYWQACTGTRPNHQDDTDRVIDRLLRYIESNVGSDLQLVDLACESALSIPHLHTLFRQRLGRTPHQFVLERKVQQACRLLSGTDYPVKQVGRECGFANVETFCRAFRKQVGTTPSRYRREV